MSNHFNFRNGFQTWKIQILHNGGNLRWENNILEFEFPKCNGEGFNEYHTAESMTKKDIGRNKTNKLFGWHIDFVADYSRFTPGKVLDHFEIITNFWQEKEKRKKLYNEDLELILFPRIDMLNRSFSVYPSEETIQIGIMRGGVFAKGNKGVVLKFHTLKMQTKFPIGNPNHLSFGEFSN